VSRVWRFAAARHNAAATQNPASSLQRERMKKESFSDGQGWRDEVRALLEQMDERSAIPQLVLPVSSMY